MQQADAQWEELTRIIQTHQERQTGLRQRLEHLHLALTLLGERTPCPSSALEMQIEALKQHIARLEQEVSLANARRSAVARQFEQNRLALAALRRSPLRQKPREMRAIGRLFTSCFQRPWRVCWSALQQSCNWSEIIPNDASLKSRSHLHTERRS